MNFLCETVMVIEKAWQRNNLWWLYMEMVLFVLLCDVSAD